MSYNFKVGDRVRWKGDKDDQYYTVTKINSDGPIVANSELIIASINLISNDGKVYEYVSRFVFEIDKCYQREMRLKELLT